MRNAHGEEQRLTALAVRLGRSIARDPKLDFYGLGSCIRASPAQL